MLSTGQVLVSLLVVGVTCGQLNLLAVGDWGGASAPPYTTVAQLSVAKAMGIIGAARNISEVWAPGGCQTYLCYNFQANTHPMEIHCY